MLCAIALTTAIASAARPVAALSAALLLSTAAAMAAPRTVTPGSGPVLVTGASGLVGAPVALAGAEGGELLLQPGDVPHRADWSRACRAQLATHEFCFAKYALQQ